MVVVDYSAPNVAKEMHVGNLRSTIIGDALVRMLGFAGHHLIRENHIGDWGRPFGMLIEHMLDIGEEAAAEAVSIGDLDGFYKAATAKFEASEEFQARARQRVVLLQGDDPDTLEHWAQLVALSTRYFNTVYRRLGVLLTDDDLAGESRYEPLHAGRRRAPRAGRSARRIRRRRSRLPAGLHQPRRRAAAAHHPIERRRFPLRDVRPGVRARPRRAARRRPVAVRRRRRSKPALPDGVRGGAHGGLAERGDRRGPCAVRRRPRHGPQDVCAAGVAIP